MPQKMSRLEIMEKALTSMGGVVIVDANCSIIYLNDEYGKIQGIDTGESIGKQIQEVIPNTRLPVVMETGKPELAQPMTLKTGETNYVNRVPIFREGELIGAIGYSTFADIYEIDRLKQKIIDMSKEVKYYQTELKSLRGAKYTPDQIMGSSPAVNRLKLLMRKVAQTRSTVLIQGESGTGKELFAHGIHYLSSRSHFPFIRLNCSAIPENLIEAELFGYTDGAFTGAKKGGSIGKFELANKGTLLLDEINSLPYHLQSKLLRVIQEKEIQKIGSATPLEIDVRLIFTTNQDLMALVEQNDFREDLYYRINVVELKIPPLRERMEDIPDLVAYLIPKLNHELGLNITGIDQQVLELFQGYHWPGNVRELEHCLERGFNHALMGKLEAEHFDFFSLRKNSHRQGKERELLTLKDAREDSEKKAIVHAMRLAGGNKKQAAEMLEIDRSVLYDKLKKYEMEI